MTRKNWLEPNTNLPSEIEKYRKSPAKTNRNRLRGFRMGVPSMTPVPRNSDRDQPIDKLPVKRCRIVSSIQAANPNPKHTMTSPS